jgi:hypothetical protein
MLLIIFFSFYDYRGFVVLFTICNRLKEVCVLRSEEKRKKEKLSLIVYVVMQGMKKIKNKK